MDGGGFGKNRASINLDKTGARLRSETAKQLIRAQMKKAKDLACECVKKKYEGC